MTMHRHGTTSVNKNKKRLYLLEIDTHKTDEEEDSQTDTENRRVFVVFLT